MCKTGFLKKVCIYLAHWCSMICEDIHICKTFCSKLKQGNNVLKLSQIGYKSQHKEEIIRRQDLRPGRDLQGHGAHLAPFILLTRKKVRLPEGRRFVQVHSWAGSLHCRVRLQQCSQFSKLHVFCDLNEGSGIPFWIQCEACSSLADQGPIMVFWKSIAQLNG